jgi:hypothetical protein
LVVVAYLAYNYKNQQSNWLFWLLIWLINN